MLVAYAESVIRGGAALIQYRDKVSRGHGRLEAARRLQSLCASYRVPLIINDDVALARAVGAAGVHVGRDDTALGEARRALGDDAIIGVSCYDSLSRAVEAEGDGADYVAFGSVFPSPTKPDARRASADLIRQARARLTIPIAAIGGITFENARSVLDAGADLLAVISDLSLSPKPEERARSYAELFFIHSPEGQNHE